MHLIFILLRQSNIIYNMSVREVGINVKIRVCPVVFFFQNKYLNMILNPRLCKIRFNSPCFNRSAWYKLARAIIAGQTYNGRDVSRSDMNAPRDVTRALDESRTPHIRTQPGPEPHGQGRTRRTSVHLRPPLANSAARPPREDGDGKKQARGEG